MTDEEEQELRAELAKYKEWHAECCSERTEARGDYAGAMAKLEIFEKAGYRIENGEVWGPSVLRRIVPLIRKGKP